MTSSAPEAETAEHRVLREQVAALYANVLGSTIADMLLAWGVAALFWWRLQDPMAFLWLALHVLQSIRYPLLAAYFRDPQAGERSAFWARRQWRELLIYSTAWGLAPWLLLPAGDHPLTYLLVLVMLGLVSGGIPSVTPRWASVLSFVVPMMAGLVGALLWRGEPTHLFLAACVAVYAGAMLHFAWRQHQLLAEALATRFEKELLAEQLAEQVTATRRASEEKTRFFAAANHDLRQPLHAIALFGAVIERELKGRAALVHAQRLMGAVRALGSSLDAMLDVSRLDAGVMDAERRPVALNDVFTALLAVFGNRAEQAGLQLRLRATRLWVVSDPHLLQRLLANLVENAIKYTPHGGVLVVARSRGDRVWLDVVDTGIGIAAEHAGRVFDEFYQVDNPGRDRSRGLGMGLAIVRRLAALLEHPIELRSRTGRGSRFRLVLDACDKPAQDGTAAPIEESATPPRLPRRVLMVDDEADITQATAALLAGWGVDLIAVADEAAAAEMLERASSGGAEAPFGALICDFRLADGADGLAAAQRLRQRFAPNLPLLLITGETAPERLQRVRDAGVPVLYKPVEASRLRRALGDLVAS